MKQFLKNVTDTSSIITPTGEPNWKMVSAILFLLLLLLIGVTVSSEILRPKNLPPQPSPTPQILAPSLAPVSSITKDTRDWKTYTNLELGISFSYPVLWSIKEEGHSIDFYAPNNDHAPLRLYYFDNPDQLTLEAFQQKLSELPEGGPRLYRSDDEVITMTSSISARYREKNFCEPVDCQTYVWGYKNKVYQLQNYKFNQVPNQDEIFKRVFSSFGFLDQQSGQR